MRISRLIAAGAALACAGLVLGEGAGSAAGPLALIGGSELHRSADAVWSRAGAGTLTVMAAARADQSLTRPSALSGMERSRDNRVISRPVITRVEVAMDGKVRFDGIGTPGSRVTLNRFGAPVGAALVASNGGWQLMLDPGLTMGEHRFETVATAPDVALAATGGEVRIAIPRDFGDRTIVAFERTPAQIAEQQAEVNAETRRRAEDLAKAASERFTEIEGIQRGPRVSQAPGNGPASRSASPGSGDGGWLDTDRMLLRVQEWLERANRDFQRQVVRRLQQPPPQTTAADLVNRNSPVVAAPAPLIAAGADAPDPGSGKAEPPAVEAAAPAAVESKQSDEAARRKAAEAKAAAEAEAAASRERAEEAARRKAAEAKAAAEAEAAASRERAEEAARRKAAEAKAAAEAEAAASRERAEEAARRKAAEAKAAAEAEAAASRERAEEAARRKAAEAKAAAEAEAAASRERAEEAARRKAAEAKAAAEAEAAASRERAEEAARRKAAEAKAAAEAEAAASRERAEEAGRRKAAEAKAAAEAEAAASRERAEEAARRKAAEAKAAAEAEAAASRERAEEAARRKAAEAKAAAEAEVAASRERAEEAAHRRAAEAKAAAEAKRRLAAQTKKAEARRPTNPSPDKLDAADLAGVQKPAAGERRPGAPVQRQPVPERDTVVVQRPGQKEPDSAKAPASVAREREVGDRDKEPATRGAGRVSRAMANPNRRCRSRAGRRIRPPGTYVVAYGDSLWTISARHYLRGYLFPVIVRANRKRIADPDLIFPCQRFYLPRIRHRR